MKKLSFIILLAALSLFVGCKKDSPEGVNQDSPTVGEMGALKGEFSVSATKKVRFSQGNLQYRASTNSWRFADKQYDLIGTANNLISVLNDGWIDLFGWGATGDNRCLPYLSNQEVSAYPSDDIAGTRNDWGTCSVDNGGNGDWRTLTAAEWKYLAEERPNADRKIALATVGGVPGLMLIPDEWEIDLYVRTGVNGSFSNNEYTEEQWKDALIEESGVVFLPAAGGRVGQEVSSVGDFGGYWTSTYFDDAEDPYCFMFYEGGLHSNDHAYSYFGLSVRLVRDK